MIIENISDRRLVRAIVNLLKEKGYELVNQDQAKKDMLTILTGSKEEIENVMDRTFIDQAPRERERLELIARQLQSTIKEVTSGKKPWE